MAYVAYYRVSTQKQGKSGLGLEAQKSVVKSFVQGNTACVLAEFTDVESGKNNERPNLLKAIEVAKQHNAKLLIAKLDRLSRNAAFIFTLKESQVDFICCDMPSANSVTIGIMAVLAQDERERISQRTKAALQEAKRMGKKLGSPDNLNPDAIRKGQAIRRANAINHENNRKALALIVSMYDAGKSFTQISKSLNEAGFKTRRNCSFQPVQVQRLYERALPL